ncbi:MAG: electron transport complex subunit RsxC [Lentisphaerae bacterium]|nr:electron transport complex subunit RsxC [Lentisphaerota bacterium]
MYSDNPRKFIGGVHPDDGKALSCEKPIRIAPLLEKYIVPIPQNIGKPPKVIVNKGDLVKKGQLIAEADGFVSVPLHAPTSGTVGETVLIPGAVGTMIPAVEIISDGQDEWGSALEPIPDWKNTDREILKKRIFDAGIIGMGGAAFPSHVKLSPPPEKVIDTLILNGAECEPYLTADHRLMLEHPNDVLEGAAIAAKILKVNRVFVGIEENKQNAIDAMKEIAGKYGIKIVPLRVRYPQGAEKQLIMAITGRHVVAGGLPMDVGCVVQNVGTCAAIRAAVVEGHPLIERMTTITGSPVKDPCTWQLRIGTPVAEALKMAGGVIAPAAKLILGGPMMGFAQATLDGAVAKNSSGILLLQAEETGQYTSNPCIRCGRCVDACPMRLLPGPISVLVESEKYDQAEQAFVMDCVECGACSYVCPANRPLIQHFRRAKAEINALRRAGKK